MILIGSGTKAKSSCAFNKQGSGTRLAARLPRRSDKPMRNHPILVLIALLLFSGCSVFAPLPPSTNSDPNIGGGQVSSPGSEAGDKDIGGGVAGPENKAPTAVMPGNSGAPTIDLEMIRPGETVKQGNLSFTLGLLRISESRWDLEYTVSGLDAAYLPLDPPVSPAVLLPNGILLPTIRDEGSGSPGSETVTAVFPSIPPETDIFLLLIENRWAGETQTWRVPVSISP